MENIFDKPAFDSIKNRLDQLTADSQSQWGKMNVGQMVHHCQAPLNIILKKKDYNLKPNWLVNLFFKKALYNDTPYRKGLPTAKAFIETEDRDFQKEKQKLNSLLDELWTHREKEDWGPHPSFGKLNKQQWGQMQYKHLDHHLKQFGA